MPDAFGRIELSGRNQSDPALTCFHSSARRDDVPSRKDFGDISRTQTVGREALLRIVQIDGLRQNAASFYLGNFESSLDGSANQVRKIVQFRIAVFVAGNLGQSGSCLARIADDRRLPGIGMQLRSF